MESTDIRIIKLQDTWWREKLERYKQILKKLVRIKHKIAEVRITTEVINK